MAGSVAQRELGEDFDQIVASLKDLEEDQTLLVQSGKPVGVFQTHKDAPRVLIANSNLVPHWANWDHFNTLDKKGLAMYGQMTAGSWIYIGSRASCRAPMKPSSKRVGNTMTATSKANGFSPAVWAVWVGTAAGRGDGRGLLSGR